MKSSRRDPNRVLIVFALRTMDVRWETFFSMLQIVTASEILKGYEFEIIPAGGGDVCHARNLGFHYWRTRSKAGRLLFIDSDTKWGPIQIHQLLQWGLPFIGGLYPLKDVYLRWSYNGWSKEWDKNPKLWEVFELCTGFLSMSYEDVLVPLLREEDEFSIEDTEYRGEVGYEVMKMGLVPWPDSDGPAKRRRISEDFYLSKIVRERLGLPILADPTVQIGHVGAIDLLKFFTAQELLAKTGEKKI